MEVNELKQFGKDTLAVYIARNTMHDSGLLLRELRLLEWEIKTGKAMCVMNECVEALKKKTTRTEWLEIHKKYDAAARKFDAADKLLEAHR